MKNYNKELPVVSQANRYIKHNNQGSIQTKRRYAEGYLRFSNFIGEEFKVQNLKNTQPKHVKAYVESLENRGCSVSYIKTELSAIRFFHGKVDNAKYKKLPTNDDLKIEKRNYKQIDRKWTDDEIKNMKAICIEKDKEWIADAIDISRLTGFRIHEVVKMEREDLENALKTYYVDTVGKGGRGREVPLDIKLEPLIERCITNTPKYGKVFVDEGRKAHNVHREIQKIIRENRDQISDSDRLDKPPLTFHGLRHSYANEKYQEGLEKGYSPLESKYKTSNLLGHSRPGVTNVYIYNKE